MVAIVNDRFDLAAKLLELGADANDGSLYFAVDMHDATTDMRAHDGSRLRAEHPEQADLPRSRQAPARQGRRSEQAVPSGSCIRRRSAAAPRSTASPFYRAAIAADVDVLKLMLAKGAKVEWSPAEVKKEGGKPRAAARTRTSARRRS